MTRRDWMTACMVALAVAALTAALMAPPIAWATDPPKPVAVPELPSTELTIQPISAKVTAVATPGKAGGPVQVVLTVKCPSGTKRTVPVTVAVQSLTENPMSRMGPRPKDVTKVEAIVPVSFEGTGTATVALPLTWATPTTQAKPGTQAQASTPQPAPAMLTTTTYMMVLSSSLGGQAAPAVVAQAVQAK
jgi:hypothetical protein